jgi:hypothetical protein
MMAARNSPIGLDGHQKNPGIAGFPPSRRPDNLRKNGMPFHPNVTCRMIFPGKTAIHNHAENLYQQAGSSPGGY